MRAFTNTETTKGEQIYFEHIVLHNDGGKTDYYEAYKAGDAYPLDTFSELEVRLMILDGRLNTTTGRTVIAW